MYVYVCVCMYVRVCVNMYARMHKTYLYTYI